MPGDEPDTKQRCDWALIGLFAGLAFLVLISLIWQIADFIADGRLDALKPWQTAISALVGFTGLIITTGLGFYFATQQRKEDARLARQSREHQAGINRERDNWLQEQETTRFAARLHAEMLAHVMVSKHLLTMLKKHFKDPKRSILDPDYEAAKKVWAMEFPVYRATLPVLGALGAELDSDVVRTVQQATKQITITLHNLYQGKTRSGNGKKEIAEISTIDKEMRQSAERLRIRAGLPPDGNSEYVKRFAPKQADQKGTLNESEKLDTPAPNNSN